MHTQALEKRWHLGGMEAYASNSALRDHYVFHVARACLWCIVNATQTCTIRPFPFPFPTPKGGIYMEHTLDSIDKKIIEILQANARTPIKDIAAEVFLSSPAVSSRIEKMEKAGIISGYHAQINYLLFGYHIKAFINLEVEPYQKKEFYPFIQAIPNVIECNCVTGDYAMLIEVAFQTTIELDHFINELQHFGRTKTLIVFSTSVEHRDVPVV